MRTTRVSVLSVTAAVAAVALVSVMGGVRAPRPASAAPPTPSDQGVVVDGVGKVSGTPDVLRLQLGVEVRRADVSTALDDANVVQNRVRDAIRRHGVPAEDLQTADVSINPSYDGKGHPNGYSVTESLTVKLRDLKAAGQTISDAVTAGGNYVRLQGVSFSLEDNQPLLQKARDAAFADAKAKATRYAELSGRQLGQVELVREGSSDSPPPIAYGFPAAAQARDSAVPLDPGTSQVSVSVTVRWSLV